MQRLRSSGEGGGDLLTRPQMPLGIGKRCGPTWSTVVPSRMAVSTSYSGMRAGE
jgi:hypothetical protein